MSAAELLARLDVCPAGDSGWRAWQDVCVELLTWLFVPPLSEPIVQSRTAMGQNIRDAVFPNERQLPGPWSLLREEHSARLVPFEFKNYDMTLVGRDEVDQLRLYLSRALGRLGFICCRSEPAPSALRRQMTAFREDEKVVLILTEAHLREMLFIRERGDDPAQLVLDLRRQLLLAYE